MRVVADDLLTMSGRKPTTNWDAGSLKAEIRSAFHILEESRFDKFMDATLNALQRLHKAHPSTRTKFVDDVNHILVTANMGYTVRIVDDAERLIWEARADAAAGVASLASAAEAIADLSKEAFDHLQQAKNHLLNPSNSRSRKDVVSVSFRIPCRENISLCPYLFAIHLSAECERIGFIIRWVDGRTVLRFCRSLPLGAYAESGKNSTKA
jgi:hypothetical protein